LSKPERIRTLILPEVPQMLGLVVSAPRGGYLTTKAAKSLDAGVTNGIALNLTR